MSDTLVSVEENGLTLEVIRRIHPFTGREYLCGYVKFPSKPLKREGYGGIINHVPVHGGVTFAELQDDGSMRYGFDCGHPYDYDNVQYQNADWVLEECRRMATAIRVVADFEDAYDKADEDDAQTVVQEYFDLLSAANSTELERPDRDAQDQEDMFSEDGLLAHMAAGTSHSLD